MLRFRDMWPGHGVGGGAGRSDCLDFGTIYLFYTLGRGSTGQDPGVASVLGTASAVKPCPVKPCPGSSRGVPRLVRLRRKQNIW